MQPDCQLTSSPCRPLFTQFCANDPATLLAAAERVQDHCDAVDLNLGCPQRIARRGHYGAFLMDDWPLVSRLISHLATHLRVPVTCKVCCSHLHIQLELCRQLSVAWPGPAPARLCQWPVLLCAAFCACPPAVV